MNPELICNFKHFLKVLLNHASDLQAIIISIGAILGGFWTYFLFIQQRLRYPKLKLNMEIVPFKLSEYRKLIRVEIIIENIGIILFKSDYAELRLRQVLPIDKIELLDSINKGFDPVENNSTHLQWPCFAQREWNKIFEIEPGEHDTLYADFFIGQDIQIAEFYFYLKNMNKKNKIGWSVTKTIIL